MCECSPRLRLIADQQINEECVLPWPARQRTRLNLAQINFPQSKNTQSFEQSSRQVLHRKNQTGFICPCQTLPLAREQKEPSEILLIVFERPQQNPPAVLLGCGAGCNSSSVAQIFFDHVLHASGRVVERDCLNPAMLLEEFPALLERHRVREHTSHIGQL